MATTRYIMYNDPGHAWLKVTVQELCRLNLIGLISSYSYVSKNRKYAYLEEDGDLGIFIDAKFKLDNVKLNIIDRYTDGVSRIRNYPSYRLLNG